MGVVIKICSCRFTRSSFFCACPGFSPQRRRAHIIAQSYPVRTVIQLSRITIPSSSLDKGVSKYNPVVKKSIQFFLQDRISFTIYKNTPSFLNPLNKKTLIFLSRMKNNARIRNCSCFPKFFRTNKNPFQA